MEIYKNLLKYPYFYDEEKQNVFYIKNEKKYKAHIINGKYGKYFNVLYKKDNALHQIYIRNIIAEYIKNINYNYVFLDGDFSEIHNINEIRNIWNELYIDNSYLISDNGDLYDKDRRILLPQHLNGDRYKEVSIKGKRFFVHELVYFSFNRNVIKKADYKIDHIDNNSLNNNILNLQYIPHSLNISKDKNKSLPTGVYYKNKHYSSIINYTIDNKAYKNMWLGDFDNIKDASICYQEALQLISQNINPIKSYDNKDIHYCFSKNKWFFYLKNKKRSLYYTSPLIAEKIKNNIDNNSFYKLDNINYYYNIFEEKYIFSIEYIDGHFYNLGKFNKKNIVDEINVIINEHKGDINFVEWLNEFKNNELEYFIKEDNIDTAYNKIQEIYQNGNNWVIRKYYKNKYYYIATVNKYETAHFILEHINLYIKYNKFDLILSQKDIYIDNLCNLFCDNNIRPTLYICQYLNNDLINRFLSYKEASLQFNNQKSYKEISKCCRGLKKSYKGYVWKLEEQK